MIKGEPRVVGVDGCRQGWVAVMLADGRFQAAALLRSLSELVKDEPGPAAIAVDIPIGLPTSEPRPADLAARTLLGPRRSSVFAVPPHAVLAEDDYRKANEIARRCFGRGISKQVHALRGKILEVYELTDERMHEVHPEVSFAVMAGMPLSSSKKTWRGQQERLGLLAAEGIELPSDLGPAGEAAADDVIDAAAAAWSARRIAQGVARRLPDKDGAGGRSRAPAIWA